MYCCYHQTIKLKDILPQQKAVLYTSLDMGGIDQLATGSFFRYFQNKITT
jgi:hypothetical protein